jgi:hypothetical protein
VAVVSCAISGPLYDADDLNLPAPVSSGQNRRETPAGIFRLIQKEAEHYSKLYDACGRHRLATSHRNDLSPFANTARGQNAHA